MHHLLLENWSICQQLDHMILVDVAQVDVNELIGGVFRLDRFNVQNYSNWMQTYPNNFALWVDATIGFVSLQYIPHNILKILVICHVSTFQIGWFASDLITWSL